MPSSLLLVVVVAVDDVPSPFCSFFFGFDVNLLHFKSDEMLALRGVKWYCRTVTFSLWFFFFFLFSIAFSSRFLVGASIAKVVVMCTPTMVKCDKFMRRTQISIKTFINYYYSFAFVFSAFHFSDRNRRSFFSDRQFLWIMSVFHSFRSRFVKKNEKRQKQTIEK